MAELERRTAAAPARIEPPTDIENLPSLFSRLGDDVMTLLDAKLNLLKVEVKEDATAYARGGAIIAAGAVVATVGLTLLLIAIAFGVSTFFAGTNLSEPAQYALGFVITGAVFLAIGGITVMVMKSKLAKQDMVPDRTVEEFRKDKEWLKKEL
ncbi:MAG TPA: phage holin family protein [Pyrinomonadaceae bacterium]|nr:phage holin family protein [Pyrinomonadaceae bacterium]